MVGSAGLCGGLLLCGRAIMSSSSGSVPVRRGEVVDSDGGGNSGSGSGTLASSVLGGLLRGSWKPRDSREVSAGVLG